MSPEAMAKWLHEKECVCGRQHGGGIPLNLSECRRCLQRELYFWGDNLLSHQQLLARNAVDTLCLSTVKFDLERS